MVLNPRVDIKVNENLTLTQPGGPAVIAIVGTSQWGEVGKLNTFSSFSQIVETYKEDKSGNYTLIKGCDLAYQNGASIVKTIRIADGSEAKSSISLDGNSGAEVGVLTFTAKYDGTYGNNIIVNVITKGTGVTVEVTDGVIVEKYTNSNNADGYTTNQSIADDINKSSQLVTVAVKTGSETANLVDAVSNQALTGGLDGEASLTQSNYTNIFDQLLDNEDWDILLIPGEDSLEASDSFQSTILGKVNSRASNSKKYGIYITGITKDESITSITTRTLGGDRAVLVAPNIKYTPRYSNASQTVFNGTYLACALAGKIASQDVEISPTRKVLSIEGLSVDTTTNKEYYNLGEIETLLTIRTVPITKLEGSLKVARGVTRNSDKDSINFEINIVRILDFVKKQTQEKLDGFLGDPNLERIRKVMAVEVDGLLQQDKLDEVIVDYKPTEVLVGTSPDTVLVNMTIQPTFAVNFINVSLTVTRL